jgi:hypothetical protein
MTYSAPPGKHDDIVIALCLAAWGVQNVCRELAEDVSSFNQFWSR